MLDYDWPGNVRELENCLERACALSSGPTIHWRLADLVQTGMRNAGGSIARRSTQRQRYRAASPSWRNSAILQAIEQLHGDKLEAARGLGIGKTTLYRKLKEYGRAVEPRHATFTADTGAESVPAAKERGQYDFTGHDSSRARNVPRP